MSLSSIGQGLAQEWQSFRTPAAKDVAEVPTVGSPAPESAKLAVPRGKPAIIVFLRHCGCPFAEKSFKLLTALSSQHPNVHCIAVSHSSREATDRWVVEVGGEWEVDVVVDEERDAYAAWGLGLSSAWHAIGPATLYSAYELGKGEGIWSRASQSGSRWQTSGFFAVDPLGIVRWAHVAESADDVPDFGEALEALEPAAILGAPKPGE